MSKPVVATPIEELKRFPKYVRIGKTEDEWQRHIVTLLSKPWPREYKKHQKELTNENSWDRKVNKIVNIIEN